MHALQSWQQSNHQADWEPSFPHYTVTWVEPSYQSLAKVFDLSLQNNSDAHILGDFNTSIDIDISALTAKSSSVHA